MASHWRRRTPQHCHLRQAIGERSPIVLRFRETLSVSNDAYGTEFQALTGMYACTASPFVVGSRPGRPAPMIFSRAYAGWRLSAAQPLDRAAVPDTEHDREEEPSIFQKSERIHRWPRSCICADLISQSRSHVAFVKYRRKRRPRPFLLRDVIGRQFTTISYQGLDLVSGGCDEIGVAGVTLRRGLENAFGEKRLCGNRGDV